MDHLIKSSPYDDSSRIEMHEFVSSDADRVLDVGCHSGMFGRALKAARAIEVWGLEINPESATVASSHLDQVINAPFSDSAPIPDNYFDVIVFNDVLEHIIDPWAALTLAKLKLRSGGTVVASIPNFRHIENMIHLIKERDFRYELDGVRDKTHLRFFTKVSALRLFEESGFEVVRIVGINEDWWRPSF
ncbi:MAG: class I SAM-dependent methyltransferase, partial [Betaproteobacteria bacterium HGW-Betaproteobacteria-21]